MKYKDSQNNKKRKFSKEQNSMEEVKIEEDTLSLEVEEVAREEEDLDVEVEEEQEVVMLVLDGGGT